MSGHGAPQPPQARGGPPEIQRLRPAIGMQGVATKIITTVLVLLSELPWLIPGSVIVVGGGVT